jgi:hypothetical protein
MLMNGSARVARFLCFWDLHYWFPISLLVEPQASKGWAKRLSPWLMSAPMDWSGCSSSADAPSNGGSAVSAAVSVPSSSNVARAAFSPTMSAAHLAIGSGASASSAASASSSSLPPVHQRGVFSRADEEWYTLLDDALRHATRAQYHTRSSTNYNQHVLKGFAQRIERGKKQSQHP